MREQTAHLKVLRELSWQGLGTGSRLLGCPQGLLVGNESQDPGLGGDGGWRCGRPSLAPRAGGESPGTSDAQSLQVS